MKKYFILLMFGMLFLGLFGCTDPNGQQTPVDDNTDVNNGDTTIPSFKILSPLQGEVVEIEGKTGDVTVMLSTNDLKLIAGTENINGEGYFQFTLDNEASFNVFKTLYTFEDVALGNHELKIEILQNDGFSYVPQIVKTVSFSVAIKDTGEPQEFTVEILTSRKFSPSEIIIDAGDTIVWVNQDIIPHSLGGDFSTKPVLVGGELSHTFNEPGIYEYYSTIYPIMQGTVTVE